MYQGQVLGRVRDLGHDRAKVNTSKEILKIGENILKIVVYILSRMITYVLSKLTERNRYLIRGNSRLNILSKITNYIIIYYNNKRKEQKNINNITTKGIFYNHVVATEKKFKNGIEKFILNKKIYTTKTQRSLSKFQV